MEECSKVVYDYPRPVVCTDAIIYDKVTNKVLLIKRKIDPQKGSYCFPGGHVGDNENTIKACIREVKEETNLDVTEDEYVLVGVYEDENRDPRRQWTIAVVYYFETFSGEIKAGDDADSCEWVSCYDIGSGKVQLAFDHLKMFNDSYFCK